MPARFKDADAPGKRESNDVGSGHVEANRVEAGSFPPALGGSVPLNRYLVFSTLALVGSISDLLTKAWVFGWRGLPGQQPIWWLWEPFIGIETAVNTGGLFGSFSGNGFWFAMFSIFAGLGILYWLFLRGAAHDWWLTVALGGVMGGVIGNLYDRLGLWFRDGYNPGWRHGVRDWILFRYGEFTWPNFNIADSLLVCGAILLMWHAFRLPAEEPAQG